MDRRTFTKLAGIALFSPMVMPRQSTSYGSSGSAGSGYPSRSPAPNGSFMCYTDDTHTSVRPADSRFGDGIHNIVGVQAKNGLVRHGWVQVCMR